MKNLKKIGKMKGTILAFLAAIFSLTAWSQPVLSAQVSSQEVGEYQSFRLVYTFNQYADDLKLPNFQNEFSIVSGPMTSMQQRIINGQQSIERSWTYVIKPKRRGKFTIRPASISFKGETYSSNTITVSVISQTELDKDPNSINNKAKNFAFVVPYVSKKKVYEGEPIYADLKLVWKSDIKQPNMEDEPTFPGFFSQSIELKNARGVRNTYKGQPVIEATIRKYLLIPKQSGMSDWPNSVITIPTGIPTGRRDWFNNPEYQFVNQVHQINWPSIEVLPLPEKGKPESFNGAVGDFDLKVNVSRTEVKANESISLKVTLRGEGNLKLIDVPTIDFPPGIESYDPKYNSDIDFRESGFKGFKQEEYLLVPRYKGIYKINSLTFSYFNPSSKRYETVNTEPFEITVTEGPSAPLSASGNKGDDISTKDNVAQLGEDIRFIKTEFIGKEKQDSNFFKNRFFWILLFGSYFGFALVLLFPVFRSWFKKDSKTEAIRGAGRKAKRRLAQSKKALQNNQPELFYSELEKAINDFVSDKFQVSKADLKREVVRKVLTENNLDAEEIDQILSQCEMARYAPKSQVDMGHIYERLQNWFNKLEK